MFITFEGIDGSGKTTLSKLLAEKDSYCILTKEPTFSSERADELNLKSKNDIEREIEFCIDRICHQQMFKEDLSNGLNVICDRYIWSGLAYSKVFNPAAFDFAKAMYQHDFFIKPDVYVFVDTPVEVCKERGKAQSIEQLTTIRQAYLDTRQFVEKKSKIITTQGVGSITDCLYEIEKKIDEVKI